MKLKTLILASCVAASMGATAQAHVFQNVITGTATGTDELGVFGPQGATYTDTPFVWVQTVNDVGARITHSYSGGVLVESTVEEGGNYPPQTGGIISRLTVNGITEVVDDSYAGHFYSQVPTPGSLDGLFIDNDAQTGYVYTFNGIPNLQIVESIGGFVVGGAGNNLQGGDYLRAINIDFTAFAPFDVSLADFSNTYYMFFSKQLFGGPQPGSVATTGLQLKVNSMALASPIAAPEPQTWSLMLLGFGGLGAVMRRHRAGAPA